MHQQTTETIGTSTLSLSFNSDVSNKEEQQIYYYSFERHRKTNKRRVSHKKTLNKREMNLNHFSNRTNITTDLNLTIIQNCAQSRSTTNT